MTDDNRPDKSDSMSRAWAFWVAFLLLAILGVAAFAYSKGHVWLTGYTSPQWAAAGAWVSGIGSFVAVSVALWVSDRSRRDAERHAFAQHVESHRVAQIDSIVDLWAEVMNFRVTIEYFRDLMHEFKEGKADIGQLNLGWTKFREANSKAKTATTKTLMVVDVPEIMDYLQDLVDTLDTIATGTQAEFVKTRDHDSPDYTLVDNALNTIDTHRSKTLIAVRTHLSSPALLYFVTNSASLPLNLAPRRNSEKYGSGRHSEHLGEGES